MGRVGGGSLRAVEAFVGAGGLGLGLARAGFRHDLVVDEDSDACATIEENQRLGHPLVAGWRVVRSDARMLDLSGVEAEPDLLSGGVPCQPWSVGGKHGGEEDERDMWPTAVRLVRELRPRAFCFENVPAVATTHADYFAYVVAMLSNPEVTRREGETAADHARRLAVESGPGHRSGLRYRASHAVLEASDHGTAQSRKRLVLVGLRSDVTRAWTPPASTHSAASLFAGQWLTGRYWDERGLQRPAPDARTLARVAAMRSNSKPRDLFGDGPALEAHRTVRDAIGDMPHPTAAAPPGLPGHVRATREARAYGTRHAGAGMDEPAKTLRAGVHGVSGGSNMVRLDDGTYRHYTVRESARLQDFPDDYVFVRDNWSVGQRLLGNAVPCRLAEAVGRSLVETLH